MDLFNIENFMPHGHCYLWRTDILLTNVIPDLIISLCYMAIPFLLSYILIQRRDLPFRSTIKVFIVFIFFCSLTHIMEIINVWYPYYQLTGIIKSATALVSIASTIIILKNLKKILTLPSLENIAKNISSDMHEIMEELPVGIIYSDKKGKIDYHNKYIRNLFKYEKESLQDKDVELLIPTNLHDAHYKYKKDFFKSPSTKKMGAGRVLHGKTKSEDLIQLEIGLSPIKLKANDKDFTIIAIKDVTAEQKNKKALEEALALMNVATFGMPSLLSYIDKDGKYKFVNEAYTRNWDIKKSKILEMDYKSFLPKETVAAVTGNMDQALSGEHVNFKISVDFPKIGKRELDVFYIPYIPPGTKKADGVVVLAHDITQMNAALAQLASTNSQLEEYAFLVSHDLRAPVRHIANFIELLGDELNSLEIDNDTIKKYIKIITENSIKVQDMISGMLKIASINQVIPMTESINIKDFVQSLKTNFESEITLSTDSTTKVINTDRSLLSAVFENLIRNSISFKTTELAQIKISFNTDKARTIIDYYDNGSGIDGNITNTLFNPFIKSQKSDGLGLGMTIITRSLERINATIEREQVEVGVHFRIIIN